MRSALFWGIFLIFKFLPSSVFGYGDLLFKPLAANPYEGRVGVMTQFGEQKLRLDIGNSLDLIRFSASDSLRCSAGADFFTYTRLRSEGNFKFPVETSDYYFGINGAVASNIGTNWQGAARLRAAHISSHLIDGLADSSGRFAGNTPFVYSREFAELTLAAESNGIRLYCGINYVFSRQPRTAEPIIPNIGFDARYPVSEYFELIGGWDAKIVGVDGVYLPMNTARAGINFITSPNRGVSLNLYYSNGRSMHGMFFRERDEYIACGFQVQF